MVNWLLITILKFPPTLLISLPSKWRDGRSGGGSASDQESGGQGPPVSHLCLKTCLFFSVLRDRCKKEIFKTMMNRVTKRNFVTFLQMFELLHYNFQNRKNRPLYVFEKKRAKLECLVDLHRFQPVECYIKYIENFIRNIYMQRDTRWLNLKSV